MTRYEPHPDPRVEAFEEACRDVNSFTVSIHIGDTYGHALREAIRLARIALELPETPKHRGPDWDAILAGQDRPSEPIVWGIRGSRSSYDFGSTPEAAE